jgi:hypothetical protein
MDEVGDWILGVEGPGDSAEESDSDAERRLWFGMSMGMGDLLGSTEVGQSEAMMEEMERGMRVREKWKCETRVSCFA